MDEFFGSIRGTGPFSRAQAEQAAAAYLTSVGLGTVRYLDPARLPAHQADLRDLSKQKRNPVAREIFWAVPMLLAQRLQSAGDYQAALDWYWIVYPYDVGSAVSSYDRINTETPFRPDLTFPPRWTAKLDPFGLVANRPTPYSRYTLLSLIRCHLDFADAEFSRETDESVATARTLYLTARRLLGAAALVPQPPTNPGEPALEIPDLTALRARAGVQLTKLRGQGGLRLPAGAALRQGAASSTTSTTTSSSISSRRPPTSSSTRPNWATNDFVRSTADRRSPHPDEQRVERSQYAQGGT